MMRILARARRDERGATLILVIAFMLVMGGIGAAVTSSVTTGLNGRIVLDQVRNRQYAADGGVEFAITQVRALPLPGPAATPPRLLRPDPHYNYTPQRRRHQNRLRGPVGSGDLSRLCRPVPAAQRDLHGLRRYGTKCGQPTTPIVVRAQVNFEARKVVGP